MSLGNIKKSNRILSSLETSTKNSIISCGNKSKNYELSKSNSQCILPNIKLFRRFQPLSESTSILTKFMTNHASKISTNILGNIIPPKIFINRKIKIPSKIKTRNININNNIYKSQSLNNLFSNKNNINNSYRKEVFITERGKRNINFNQKNNINKSNYYIFEKNNIEDITNIKNTNEESFINEKELNNINLNIQYSNLISDIVNTSGRDTTKNNSSIENYKNIIKKKEINNKYSRLCRFEPIKIKNIKDRNNIKSSYKKKNPIEFFHIYSPDIIYQSNIFDEQIKLFKDIFKEYKSIMNKKNFIDVFKSMPIETKIKFNKCLEEACGTLYILPNILLGELYNLMLDLIKIKIPNEDKLLPKFIENEITTLINNNHLLIEVNNYFKKCFEFYLIISKKEEGQNNYLLEKEYFQALYYFEKLRSNILYLNNSFHNAEINYCDDLFTINKFIKNKNVIKNNIISINNNDNDANKEIYDKVKKVEEIKRKMKKSSSVIEKIGNQFMFIKEPEELKKLRIESALDIIKEKKPQYNYLGKILKNRKKLEYKSIFDNKYFDKILGHCYKNAKEKIITQKINNEINSGKSKKGYQVLKINFS